MRFSLSRHLQLYGFFRRFPVTERQRFGAEQALRLAELLQEFSTHPADVEQRARLLAERAAIEELGAGGGGTAITRRSDQACFRQLAGPDAGAALPGGLAALPHGRPRGRAGGARGVGR